MLMTTTPSVEGKKITRYCGVITGEAILGANLFKDLFAGIRDVVGGRSATYEKELQRAREIALAELSERARLAGANAVVGIDLDYEVLGQGNGMLMVSASGTAVVVECLWLRGGWLRRQALNLNSYKQKTSAPLKKLGSDPMEEAGRCATKLGAMPSSKGQAHRGS